jgi:hypothetical protein
MFNLIKNIMGKSNLTAQGQKFRALQQSREWEGVKTPKRSTRKKPKKDVIAAKPESYASLSDSEFLYEFLPGLENVKTIVIQRSLTDPFTTDITVNGLENTYLKSLPLTYVHSIREFLQGYLIQEKYQLTDENKLTNYIQKNYTQAEASLLFASFMKARALYCSQVLSACGNNQTLNHMAKSVISPMLEKENDAIGVAHASIGLMKKDIIEYHNACQSINPNWQPLDNTVNHKVSFLRDTLTQIQTERFHLAATHFRGMISMLAVSGFTSYNLETGSTGTSHRNTNAWKMKTSEFPDPPNYIIDDRPWGNLPDLGEFFQRTQLKCHVTDSEVTEEELDQEFRITTPEGKVIDSNATPVTGGINLEYTSYTNPASVLCPLIWPEQAIAMAEGLSRNCGIIMSQVMPYVIKGHRIKHLIDSEAKGDDTYFVGKLFNSTFKFVKDTYKSKLADLTSITFIPEEDIQETIEDGADDLLEMMRNEQ